MESLKKLSGKKIVFALMGVLLIGVGIAFNNCAGLGNDTVGIVYDGIRSFWGMTGEQLGMASNVVNLTLVIVLFLVGRKYVSLGTLIYFLPYGFCVNLGTWLYGALKLQQTLPVQILFSVIGCLILCMGIAIFIVVDIGVDPFTGIVLVLCDRTGKEYRVIKVFFDLTCVVVGTLLGGKLGVVTVVTAIAAGPVIQFFTGIVKKYWFSE